MSIEYRNGDVLQDSEEKRIIAHIVNTSGGFGKGFALSVAKKYPVVSNKYKVWYRRSILNPDTSFKLGEIQHILINGNLSFVNMLCQEGYKTKANPIPLDYYALNLCIRKLKVVNKDDVPIWMPKIGSGLAGGDWNTIETIINEILVEQKVIIFEL